MQTLLEQEIEKYNAMFEPQVIPGRVHSYYLNSEWTEVYVVAMRVRARFGEGGLFFTVLDLWNGTAQTWENSK